MIKVLIVDDEFFVRQGLSILIEWEELGFSICGQAENGMQAVTIANNLKPDIIITDIKMPLMDGLNLVRVLREEYSVKAKFIILSGYNEFAYAKSAMKYNVKAYILKPIDKEELITVLKEIKSEIDSENIENTIRTSNLKALAENTINNLLNGEIDNEIVEQSEIILDSKDCTNIWYAIIQTEKLNIGGNNNSFTDLKLQIKNILKTKIFYENSNHIIELKEFDGERLSLGIIITSRVLEKTRCNIKKFMEKIYKSILLDLNIKVCIYVGMDVKNLSLLKESYNSALLAHSYASISEKNNVIYYEDFFNKPFKQDVGEKVNFDLIVDAIENYNFEFIREITENIFKKFKNEFVDPKIIGININYLIYKVVKIVIKMGGEATEILCEYALPKLDFSKLTIQEISDKVIEFSCESAKYIRNLRINRSVGILSKVEKYINVNFDQSLTLKDIASHFYVNSAYLGQIFKRKLGISFNDYLLKLRIEKAKALLLRTDMKIYEISESVGYKDVDYFITNFEKLISKTPLQYRKSKQI
ncbi:response regulator transcription factor [Clostridium sp.]